MRPARTIFLALSLAVLCAAVSAAMASAAVYWANGQWIGGANLDGTGADPHYFDPSLETTKSAAPSCGLAADGRNLYWNASTAVPGSLQIDRVNLDGPTVVDSIGEGVGCELAVAGSNYYWVDSDWPVGERGEVVRASAGGIREGTLVGGIKRPCGLAVDAHHVYWGSLEGIGRANLDGTEVEPKFIPYNYACGVAVNDRYLFWGGYSGTIGRAKLDGSERDPGFITGTAAGAESYLAADAAHVYWTNWYNGGQTLSTIGRAGVDGTGVDQKWLTSSVTTELAGLAVDSRPTLAPLPLHSRPMELGRVHHNRRNGVVVLEIHAWEGGEFSVVSPEIGWKVLKPVPAPAVGAPVLWRLKLWPRKLGGLGRRIRSQLERKGRAPITLRLFFRDPGTVPVLRRKHLAFLKAR